MNRRLSSSYLEPQWPVPDRVRAVVTTRQGGVSQAPFHTFNMGMHVGDDAVAVATNRQKVVTDLNLKGVQWLQQVHGKAAVRASKNLCEQVADASFCNRLGMACAVMTADCLPVLFCDRAGTKVAAAHAGWKGLASGVLEATVTAMNTAPSELMAWLGPAIGQAHFEVGPEVREAFISLDEGAAQAFQSGDGERWYADLYQLARRRLWLAGVESVFGGSFCTFTQSDLFYSYRRDGSASGRMVSLIWLDDRS